MSAQRKRKEPYEMKLIIEEVGGELYEYLPLGDYVGAARGVSDGRPTIKHHRLDARHVLAQVNGGMPVRQVAREYNIPIAAVNEVIALADRYDYEASYIGNLKNEGRRIVKTTKSKYPPHLQAAYDEMSEDGKIPFDISFDENRAPSEFMTTDQINAEIARRRGSVIR
ncbi:MAG: DUF433 domain-containing protein [Chloracidobacterium sp.]|nr:DUF433 domain-containing protein [Chloracidobacterium sp.]